MMVARILFFGVVFVGFELIFLSYIVFLYHDPSSNMFQAKWASTYEIGCSQRKNVTASVNTQPPRIVNIMRNEDHDIWFSTFLLIIVPTRPQGIHPRQLIRHTWFEGFRNKTEDAVLRFVVGNRSMDSDTRFELTEENGTHGDIVFVNTTENDVAALTNKTLALINWAHHHVKFSYLMKSDDDTYVFVKNLIDELRQRPTTTKLYFGKMLVNSPIVRGNYKWGDNEWDLAPVYMPFAMGGGYVISHDLVATLSQDSSRLKWHVNEDTAIGAWISAFDCERRSDDRFCFWWKGRTLQQCKQPFLALLMFAFSREELVEHFHYYYEQVTTGVRSIMLLTGPPDAPTAPPLTVKSLDNSDNKTTQSIAKSNSNDQKTDLITEATSSTKKATKKPAHKKIPTTNSLR